MGVLYQVRVRKGESGGYISLQIACHFSRNLVKLGTNVFINFMFITLVCTLHANNSHARNAAILKGLACSSSSSSSSSSSRRSGIQWTSFVVALSKVVVAGCPG